MQQILTEKTRNAILDYVPQEEILELLASYFQAYSDKTRIKIISALSISNLCVGEISEMLNINQTTVSHQLKLLKSLNMVKSRREGKLIYYSLISSRVNDIMMFGVEHIELKKGIIN